MTEIDTEDGFFFLNPESREALPRFQYKGEDRSLMYRYMLSPLAQFLVHRCTPRTMAPNTITLLGLLFMVVSYSVLWFYCPTLEPDDHEDVNNNKIPRWTFLVNCVALLVYQTMDNMDGKQARRTGSSSPLGLLFDHGCDAVNSIFGSANWIISLGLDPVKDVWMCWALVLGPMGMFQVSTWEEYYTGALILPLINGPNEGLFGGAMLSLTSCIYGVQFWQSTYWFDMLMRPFLPMVVLNLLPEKGLRNADLQVALAVFGIVQEMILKVIFVVRTYGRRTLLNLLPFVALVFSTIIIGYVDLNIWLRMPRTTLHLISVLFVEMATQFMLDHLTEQRHTPFGRWILIPLTALALACCTSGSTVHASRETDDYLLVYTTAAWVFVAFKIMIVVSEMCSILNIFCFDIVHPRRTVFGRKVVENGKAKKQ